MHTVGCTFVSIVEIRCARMKRAGLVCIIPRIIDINKVVRYALMSVKQILSKN
jgi:hypothetical protein